jgi:hypothetical protein
MSGLGEARYCLVAHPTRLRHTYILSRRITILYMFFSRSGSAGLNPSREVYPLSGTGPAYQGHGELLLGPQSGHNRHDA